MQASDLTFQTERVYLKDDMTGKLPDIRDSQRSQISDLSTMASERKRTSSMKSRKTDCVKLPELMTSKQIAFSNESEETKSDTESQGSSKSAYELEFNEPTREPINLYLYCTNPEGLKAPEPSVPVYKVITIKPQKKEEKIVIQDVEELSEHEKYRNEVFLAYDKTEEDYQRVSEKLKKVLSEVDQTLGDIMGMVKLYDDTMESLEKVIDMKIK